MSADLYAEEEADRRAAHDRLAEQAQESPFTDGGAFIFDLPAETPAVWGRGQNVLWAEGESTMIVGPPGVGKTTITGQVVRALIFGGTVLGYRVRPQGRILYLAMDRPAQIARSLKRQFSPDDREAVSENLVVHKGPPPADMAKNTDILVQMCRAARAAVVVVDSLKDAAVGLSEDAVGAGWNIARQKALAAGVQVLELHHQVKRGANGEAPTTLADVYGSAWITGGAGSVILLAGTAGDPIVELRHLKTPAEPVGPFKVIHDHDRGQSTVWHAADPIDMARASKGAGVEATDLAKAMFSKDRPTANEIEKARRKLNSLVRSGHLVIVERHSVLGGAARKAYVLATHDDDESTHASTHAPLFGKPPTEDPEHPREGQETA
ncbi:hypothetical protein SCMU_19300 [Sinomonas cyclohexanicum]|uniref:AAA+ ATPase domain-containing protein n=1 Tax=Sinomonas cyclohexanicum TaxID=322009 RepID=A0ABM7PV11_SINCY|nr:AAA family ATPase [Corynebacterium cyclohexanicum]BCT76088.1 hypothetical protein SCMU_19300 [Corynebacterium cyclohexanicum]